MTKNPFALSLSNGLTDTALPLDWLRTGFDKPETNKNTR
jgi:hypothetical protein